MHRILKKAALLPDPPADKQRNQLRTFELLVRAGYLEEAEKFSERVGVHNDGYLAAYLLLYGQEARALEFIRTRPDPVARTYSLFKLAETYWEMGKPAGASAMLEEAEASCKTIPDAAIRPKCMGRSSFSKRRFEMESPQVTALPHPVSKPRPQPTLPFYPVTLDGYRDGKPGYFLKAQTENAGYREELFSLAGKRDFAAVLQRIQTAPDNARKVLAVSALEYMSIQNNGEVAPDGIAALLPEDAADATLAKAEALLAAGVELAKRKNSDAALHGFDLARQALDRVTLPDLRFGRVVVCAEIAVQEAKAGLRGTSEETFSKALRFAREIGVLIEPAAGAKTMPGKPAGKPVMSDAAREIFIRALAVNNIGQARKAAEVWRGGAKSMEGAVVRAWLEANLPDEAAAFAETVPDITSRVAELLRTAAVTLDTLGAPTLLVDF